MKKLEGDLLKLVGKGRFDLIVHGCNCFCSMGGGIALQIKNLYPEAYLADCQTKKGAKEKLGTCSVANIHTTQAKFVVVNAYIQHHYAGSAILIDYDALRNCFAWIKEHYRGKKIGLPKIGAGLAGGDWEVIEAIIEKELKGEDVTVVSLPNIKTN